MSDRCIFCEIVKGTIQGAIVYEDADMLAFLDLHPVRNGHLLVIPKRHTDDFLNMEAEEYGKVMAVAQKLGRVVRDVVHPVRVGLLIKGFDVPHVHVHLIPMEDQWDLISSRHGNAIPPQAATEYFAEFTEKFKRTING